MTPDLIYYPSFAATSVRITGVGAVEVLDLDFESRERGDDASKLDRTGMKRRRRRNGQVASGPEETTTTYIHTTMRGFLIIKVNPVSAS